MSVPHLSAPESLTAEMNTAELFWRRSQAFLWGVPATRSHAYHSVCMMMRLRGCKRTLLCLDWMHILKVTEKTWLSSRTGSLFQAPGCTWTEIDRPNFKCLDVLKVEHIISHAVKEGCGVFGKRLISSIADKKLD